MYVTVAVCTWNRAWLLDQTLTKMHQLEVPAGVQWELLVVNNNCSDDTDSVIASHSNHLPLRRLCEPTPGKSHALNAAIEAVRGDLILWTDDDVLVDPRWLAEYVKAAQTLPHSSFFGGSIDPWFETPPPDWLVANWPRLSSMYAVRELPDEAFAIDRQMLPFGANFAIRTEIQRAFLYNPRLGRVGPSEVRGEETELFERLLEGGHHGYWCPAAKVQHFIPQPRISEDYVRRFYYGYGQTSTVLDDPILRGRSSSWQRFKLAKRALRDELKYRIVRRIGSAEMWLTYLIRASYNWGRLAGVNDHDVVSEHKRTIADYGVKLTERQQTAA
jgi:glycosyltransferase involved in cell wall biosynthesis